MFRLIFLILFAIAGSIVVVALTKPNSFRYSRALAMKAPPERIFAVLTDLNRGIEWSPFEQTDPDMSRTFYGPATGVGAIYEWAGNREAGAGRMEIVEIEYPERVALALTFLRPFKASNRAEFTLEPLGDDETLVRWTMSGPQPFIGKLVSVFIDCEKMIAGNFEKGLANLKNLVEQ